MRGDKINFPVKSEYDLVEGDLRNNRRVNRKDETLPTGVGAIRDD